jgi:UDP-glucose 4-epimerase
VSTSSAARRVLVTGGAGFIGSHLVDRLLAEGYAVDVIDDLSSGSLANLRAARSLRGPLMVHQLDVRQPEVVDLIASRRPAVVFHLAAQADVRVSVQRPTFDAEVNVIGTINVLEGARAAGTARVVYAASGGTLYGEPAPDALPVPESHPMRPLSPYGVSKKAAIDYLVAYRELHALEFVALALANVYGPRQDPHGEAGVVAIFAERLLGGRPLTIYGDGTQTRDFVHVDDAVDAFVRAMERGGGLVINIGTGVETSVRALAELMARRAGVPLEVAFAPPRPGELARSALDPSRAALHLGWRPFTELADGIDSVLEFVRAELEGSRAP